MEKNLRLVVNNTFHRFKTSRLIKNATSIIVGKLIQMIFGLVIGVISARYLGPSNYGLISYAAAYTAFFSIVCTLGTNNLLVKEFIDGKGNEGKIIGTSIGLRIVSSVLSIGLIVAITMMVDAGEKTTITVVFLTSLSLLFHQPVEAFDYWIQSRLESKVTATATLVSYLFSSLLKIYFLVSRKSVEYFAFITSLDYICLGIILALWYQKKCGDRLSFSTSYGRSLIKRSFPLILSGLMFSLYSQIDKMMLKQMLGEVSVGHYSIAIHVCTMWSFVLSAIITSFFPSIMETAKSGNNKLFSGRNKQLYATIFYISTFVSIILTLFSDFIIRILYGEAYAPSAGLMKIITWYTAFSFMGSARAAWTVAKGYQKHLFKINLSSACFNIFLNCVLIPNYGTYGAAVASLISSFFITLIFPLFIKDMRENAILMLEAIILKGLLWGKTT